MHCQWEGGETERGAGNKTKLILRFCPRIMDHGERRSSGRPGLGPKHAGGSGPPLPGHSAPRSHSVRGGESWKRVLEALRIRVALQELTETADDGETGPANNPISVAWLRGQLAGIRTLPCSTLPSVGVTAAAVAGTFPSALSLGRGGAQRIYN